MKRWLVTPLLSVVLVVLFGSWTVAQADDDDDNDNGKGGQSDHALLDFTGRDTAGYCGVGKHVEPWTFHASATATGSLGTLTIQFRDTNTITFSIPGDSSFSLTQALGGVPGTDDLIRITGTGSVRAMISALVRSDARDPFIESAPNTPQKNNFCVSLPNEANVASRLQPVPAGWEVGPPGSNLQ